MPSGLIIFLAIAVLYGALAGRLSRLSITMPIIFLVVGALIGPTNMLNTASVEALIEMTLALLLFADASTLNFRRVSSDAFLPARLLLVALPLVIALGGLLAYAFFAREGLGFALLLAAILAPTDAALGLPVFNNPRVPPRIRRALNVESGLNDGIATPIVTLFTALALANEFQGADGWLIAALVQIGIGAGAGIAAGLLGGWLYSAAVKNSWTNHTGEQIGNLALALLAFWAAKMLGGNGFVAAFVGGISFSFATRERLHVATEFTETSGTLLSLFVWTVFGANLIPFLFKSFTPLAILYALLSLTLVRMLPVAISLIGTHLRLDTKLIMGWFGPRGLASVVFLLIAFEAFHEGGRNPNLLVETASWTVVFSVLLHGFLAQPLANWYAKRLESASPDIPDLVDVVDIHIRKPDPMKGLKNSRPQTQANR